MSEIVEEDDLHLIRTAKQQDNHGPGPMDSHLKRQVREEAEWLMETGLSFELTAIRLGYTEVALEKIIERDYKRSA
jgi:hypothetical protein